MHNNYYFLRQLSATLRDTVVGYTLVSCFSQTKDELIIELNNGRRSFFIKANLSPGYCCLSFPEKFARARKNSVDLFEQAVLKKINGVTQFDNERSFSLEFDGLALVFKMHNQFANVLLMEGGIVTSIFRNHLQADFEITPAKLHRSIDFSKEAFLHNAPRDLYVTFGKIVWEFLAHENFDSFGKEEQWTLMKETLRLLESPRYYILKQNEIRLSLLPLPNSVKELDEPVAAANAFADRFFHERSLSQEKAALLHQLHTKLNGAENFLARTEMKLSELINDHHFQLWGDLLMANMHALKAGQERVSLQNFYDERQIEIKLKKELSPQRNAEVFYRKAKNQQIEITKRKEAIGQKQNEITKLKSLLESCQQAGDLTALSAIRKASGMAKKSDAPEIRVPYHEFDFKGFRILVGKNAVDNDELTLKYSYKEDLWLHAKDVAGSHVLIKYQSGKKFPKDVIEYAAGLAAFNSKRKGEALCPVSFTPKKFVRKRKGDPPGSVVVEREEVILVTPVNVKE